MTFVVKFRDNVVLKGTPALARMLGALDLYVRTFKEDLTVTSGADGLHSGPSDPHMRGVALDVSVQNLHDPEFAKNWLQKELGNAFYVLHEMPGATPATTGEHLHIQASRGTVYPPLT